MNNFDTFVYRQSESSRFFSSIKFASHRKREFCRLRRHRNFAFLFHAPMMSLRSTRGMSGLSCCWNIHPGETAEMEAYSTVRFHMRNMRWQTMHNYQTLRSIVKKVQTLLNNTYTFVTAAFEGIVCALVPSDTFCHTDRAFCLLFTDT